MLAEYSQSNPDYASLKGLLFSDIILLSDRRAFPTKKRGDGVKGPKWAKKPACNGLEIIFHLKAGKGRTL